MLGIAIGHGESLICVGVFEKLVIINDIMQRLTQRQTSLPLRRLVVTRTIGAAPSHHESQEPWDAGDRNRTHDSGYHPDRSQPRANLRKIWRD